MTEFEKLLEECLSDLELGKSDVEECLTRHPKYAPQLKPILLTTVYLERGREARPSAAFKARVRAKLAQQMQAHPRKAAYFKFTFMRLAAGLAAIVLTLLATGTAYAQGALPGEAFYGWKLASENAWRTVTPDPVGTDLAIADRRVDELLAVGNDPALHSQVLKSYLEVAARLKSEMNTENEARISQALDSQIKELNQSGIPIPQPNQDVLPQFEEPTLTPTVTPLPILETPQVNPTDLPEIIPTIQVPPPPKIVPTIEIPPPIP